MGFLGKYSFKNQHQNDSYSFEISYLPFKKQYMKNDIFIVLFNLLKPHIKLSKPIVELNKVCYGLRCCHKLAVPWLGFIR